MKCGSGTGTAENFVFIVTLTFDDRSGFGLDADPDAFEIFTGVQWDNFVVRRVAVRVRVN